MNDVGKEADFFRGSSSKSGVLITLLFLLAMAAASLLSGVKPSGISTADVQANATAPANKSDVSGGW